MCVEREGEGEGERGEGQVSPHTHLIAGLLRERGTLVQREALDQLCREDTLRRELWEHLWN